MNRMPRRPAESPHSPLEKFLWGAVIISLAFTDFCFFGDALGSFGALSTFIIALLWLVLLPRMARGEFSIRFNDRSVELLALFVLICALSIFLSADAPTSVWSDKSPWSLSLRQCIQLIWGVSVAFLTIHFIRTWKDFRFALGCCFVGFILAGCAGILETYDFYYGNNFTLEAEHFLNTFGYVASYWAELRFRLLSPEPSMAANYLVCFMPLLFFKAYYWKSSLWSACFAGLSALLLLGTFSLGGIVAFMAQLLIALFFLRRRDLGKILVATALPIFLLVAIYPSQAADFSGRLSDLIYSGRYSSDYSARIRAAQVETAYNTFLDHPLLGVGIGNEISYVVKEFPGWATRDPITSWLIGVDSIAVMSPNNLIAQILAETGVLGGLTFVLFLISIVGGSFRSFTLAKEPWKKAVYVSILVSLAGQIFHYMGMSGWYFRYWFFVWGLAISAKYLNSQTDPLFVKSPNVLRRLTAAPVRNLSGWTGVDERKRLIRQL